MWFRVKAALTYDFPKPRETLLLLEAARTPDQAVHAETLAFDPEVEAARLDDSVTGERRVVFTAAGRQTIAYEATVEVLTRDLGLAGAATTPVRDLPPEALRYLHGSRYCPSDRFERFARRRFGHVEGGDKVQAILDWMAQGMTYEIGVSDSATTAIDTFVDRAGVCRDFAHLMIAICRAADIPARAVSAYAWKLKPEDLHAVVEVYVGGRWRLIDPTGKAPVDGLVRVATGLDAAEIAFMTIFGEAELVSQSFSIRRLAGRAAG
ncbi:MAG: transglutaminase-like domain-containing protein [Caulobacteraceae bacterium]